MRRSRGSITRRAIVQAGLEVADQCGVEAVTLRAAAEHMGVEPTSLQARVECEQELLDLMHCEIARRLYEGAQHATWQAEVLAVCTRMRNILMAHPHWIELMMRPSPPVLRLRTRDRVLGTMTAAGMSVEDAFRTLAGALTVAAAMISLEVRTTSKEGKGLLTSRIERTRLLPRSADEQTSSATDLAVMKIDGLDPERLFSAAMRGLIREFEARP